MALTREIGERLAARNIAHAIMAGAAEAVLTHIGPVLETIGTGSDPLAAATVRPAPHYWQHIKRPGPQNESRVKITALEQ